MPGHEPLIHKRTVRGFGQVQAAGAAGEQRHYKAETIEDAAVVLEQSSLVVVIPGYGMAVAQAQHRVRELYDELIKRGIQVKFAIHPVAGRMPGHMNVLAGGGRYSVRATWSKWTRSTPKCPSATWPW